MASYEETRQTQLFYVGYTCSKCKAVTIAEAMLVAVGRAPFRKGANRTAEKAFEDGMVMIRNGHVKPYRVKTVYEFRNETGFNTYGAYYVEHLYMSCPYCGNREVWLAPANVFVPESFDYVDVNTRNKIKSCPEESRPRFFESKEHVKAWKVQTLSRMMADTSVYWKEHLQDAKRLKYELNTKIVQMVDLERMKESVGGMQKELQRKISEKTQEAKGYSLFSKERKAVNGEIKALEQMLSSQKAADDQQLRQLNGQIAALEAEKKNILCANPGLIGTLQTFPSPTPMLFEVDRLD